MRPTQQSLLVSAMLCHEGKQGKTMHRRGNVGRKVVGWNTSTARVVTVGQDLSETAA